MNKINPIYKRNADATSNKESVELTMYDDNETAATQELTTSPSSTSADINWMPPSTYCEMKQTDKTNTEMPQNALQKLSQDFEKLGVNISH